MKNKGITLVALVITIVVLIILAAVAINLSLGNNGIFNRAKTAKEQYSNEQSFEDREIATISNSIDKYATFSRAASNINYSDSKQDTGLKWLNGETIYQRTYRVNNPTRNAYNTVDKNLNCDNAFLINAYGIVVFGDGVCTSFPMNEGTRYYTIKLFNYNENGLSVFLYENNNSVTYSDLYVTVQYIEKQVNK